jgi:hypothetical protein
VAAAVRSMSQAAAQLVLAQIKKKIIRKTFSVQLLFRKRIKKKLRFNILCWEESAM